MMVGAYSEVHLAGNMPYHKHIPASATEASAPLDHVSVELCCCLCDKTLAMDSLGDK